MVAKWRYEDNAGVRLAEISLDEPPPIGWPVTMIGPEPGPCREYLVIAVRHIERTLVLAPSREAIMQDLSDEAQKHGMGY